MSSSMITVAVPVFSKIARYFSSASNNEFPLPVYSFSLRPAKGPVLSQELNSKLMINNFITFLSFCEAKTVCNLAQKISAEMSV